jgi:hypothetical protein
MKFVYLKRPWVWRIPTVGTAHTHRGYGAYPPQNSKKKRLASHHLEHHVNSIGKHFKFLPPLKILISDIN